MYSEIFEEFIKIVQAQDSNKSNSGTNTENPRKLSVKEIADLYGIKPNTLDGMNYENNMSELAHPKPVVVAPAYDKANGLIENVNERQLLIEEVVKRQPRGQNINRNVLAKQELILNLVRLGNELDNKGEEKLTLLADKCLEQLQIKKQAFAWIPWLVGAALSMLTLEKQLPEANRGLVQNSDNLISQLTDLTKSNANFGVGTKYKTDFVTFVNEVIQTVKKFKDQYDSTFNNFNSLQISSARDMLNKSDEIKNIGANNDDVLKDLYSSTKTMILYINKVISIFNNNKILQDQVEETGVLTGVLEKSHIVDTVADFINPFDDINDVKEALAVYKESLENVIITIENGGKVQKQYESYADKLLSKVKNNKSNVNDITLNDL